MGCAASKLHNEDTVRRCKERRRLMKEAVYARHHFASAHADYCRSLHLTGVALLDFAAVEPLSVSDQTPAVFLRSISSVSSHPPPPPKPPQPPSHSPSSLRPPTPPTYIPSPSPTITSSKVPHILSASSLASKKRRQHKLPHILSESSPSSSPKSLNNFNYSANFAPKAYSSYSNTPSQASSAWNWENFYPPSPPGSDFFDKKRSDQNSIHSSKYDRRSDFEHDDEDEEEEEEEEEESTEREEVHCSEWGDHYSTTSSDSEREVDRETRSEIDAKSSFKSTVKNEDEDEGEKISQMYKANSFVNKSEKSDDAGSSFGGTTEISDLKLVVRHKDLAEIFSAIREYFDKAAEAGEQVSEMLETSRAQLDRSFRQLKKTVYHSSSVLNNLSSSWTSKPPLAVKYRLDAAALEEPGGHKSLCSTLERLLAWEKKLYEEVKAREGVKIEHEKKLSTLQSQEYRGDDEAKLDKTKASIKRLQSLIIVTSQAVSATSSSIIGLRDSDLVPQLVQLCHGLMYMWRSMNQSHEIQNHIVQQVRGLVNRAAKGDSTSDMHRQVTRDLESAVSAWHSSFCRLIKYQRDFICSLHGWLKLTLHPINNEIINSNKEPSSVLAFCDEWKLALDRLPDTVASESIKSFVNVVHAISVRQAEELKIKKRTETVSKELERKASSLRNIEKKYYNSYSMVGIGLPDGGADNEHALDARDPLAEKKSELATCQRKVEDEMMRHSKAVEVTRAMTLNHIQTGLPGVFQAMTSFSGLFSEALEVVCTRSYSIN
ncbi:protein of unknown function DUF632 [Dillenia turbinata]|uniref:DUF632 domain-containing protein n=1 Tax=Dillenia turbinata TaxID=194707 RepID=A0AAN8V095_9MAGN